MSAHDYRLADRIMHRLALGSRALAELSFDLDQKLSRASASAEAIADRPHVFVTGLARAGTTIILRHLHETGQFRSLTYRDMPFPLAPNLWKRVSAGWHRAGAAKMRAHGDGIAIDGDSPEALEEVFWRIQCGADYLRPDGLHRHRPHPQEIESFRHYVAAILASAGPEQQRYLSKNNNNVLRIPALRAAFPSAFILLPFRHPATHALSLWRQHRHFCTVQAQSGFVRAYMDWLGHHEFGLGHIPFLPDDEPRGSPEQPDYWLRSWIRVNGALMGEVGERTIPVCHEVLCSTPAIWNDLLYRLALPRADQNSFARPPRATDEEAAFSPALMREAQAIYDGLRAVGR